MANTTKDEEPRVEPVSSKTDGEKPQKSKSVVSSKTVTEDDVKALYNKGKNLYDIAREVFGFESEEAIERIRRILGIMQPPETRIMEED